MLPKKIFQEVLKKQYNIDKKAIASYEKEAKKFKKELEQYIIDEGVVDEVELYTISADMMKVPFITVKDQEIKKEILNLIPPPLAQAHKIIAFKQTEKEIYLAMTDPQDIQTIGFVEKKTGKIAVPHLTTPTDIKDALHRYHADLEQDLQVTQLSDGEEDVDAGELKKAAEEVSIINIINSIVEHAVYEGASDIHIEPLEKEVDVRYRVDGILRTVMTLPKKVQNGIMARIKILANLKIDEHMLPQDGRFKIQLQEDKFSFRVSIIPVYDGEKIVMRLLHEGQKPIELDQLGFLPKAKEIVAAAIKKPHGMILVTGPTGSGKSTTLYSILGMLNKPDVNISTIEDPIEYHVKGINQSQVNPRAGFTFAGGLRAFLRQDPDIIMVGEIRDKETAEIGIHAAMTGHLVLSTLHTNDAPTTLPRLLDMGVAPFLVAFTMNIIVAQRLVRRICEHCKEEFTLEAAAIKELERIFQVKNIVTFFESYNVSLNKKEKDLKSITFYRGKGCRRCGNSGYKGRIGIYEVLEMDKELQQKINEQATTKEIKKHAIEKGMTTMLEDGMIKAKQGITTIEEILRVTRE
ncbi:MAG: type II/IV secretion system protein [Candidatus Magasanikbacteria bacterium]|jgi:type IV pilus assembly protein PilB|nr:type II/IV secretion system protein [Candidatus Magasanikbacteria bacterium]MBT4071913.1 type II/IV secretion system protein [Candidatus Magasanikbacteria bacterium]